MGRRGGSPKPKRVVYELIATDDHPDIHRLLNELVGKHHQDLGPARIALAWCDSWKPNVDGRVTLGKCKKATDLDREITAFDFVILLSRTFWQDISVTDLQRRALLDHELCHAAPRLNKYGDPAEDARGRRLWRVRKHDLEEFNDVVERYGLYKRDIETFAAALGRAKQGVLNLVKTGT